MLELRGITKVYPAGGENVQALKGIDLSFRESEFVSILGPSGCGKTTMLNIIGGLDQYTNGDLIINGQTTKNFKDRDWDTYRNHSVGFVFQSYNLIPHQSVLRNVELALTLSGVKKKERRQRAVAALERVGLGDQLSKRPSEMSGGQMQRVAIARAIVNDPDIILADEPTGALDTETSVQVMDILKEIAADRLVIMVTHNPELAERYSTRIVRMLDGVILDDSNPIGGDELALERENAVKKAEAGRNRKIPSMSFATSFGLSLNNLITKKGRTILTAFAGSIGIIGIALIYAVSQGTTDYINSVQEDTLASYPITLQAESVNIGSLLSAFMGSATSVGEHENDAVYQKAMLYDMTNAMNSLETDENDLQSFKTYLDGELEDTESESGLAEAVSAVQYTYDLDLLFYTRNVDGDIIRSDSQTLMVDLMKEYLGMDMSTMLSMQSESVMGSSASMMSASSNAWQELLAGDDGELISPVVEGQYDIIYGTWPTSYDEVVLFVDENNELDDLTLYALGLTSKDEIDRVMRAAADKTVIDYEIESWSYEQLCQSDFRLICNSDCYSYDEMTGTYTDLRETDTGLKYLYDNGLTLKVVGIARPNADAISSMVSGSVGYTHALVEHVAAAAEQSDAVKAQKADPTTDVFTGLTFRDCAEADTDAEKAEAVREYIDGLDEDARAGLYISIMSVPDDASVEAYTAQTLSSMTRADMEATIMQSVGSQMSVDEATVQSYVSAMSDEELSETFGEMVAEQYRQQYAASITAQMAEAPSAQLSEALSQLLAGYDDAQCAALYDDVIELSDADYEENLVKLGCVDLSDPTVISIYASSFENKDVISDAITSYNESVDELSQISYTDYIGIMLSSVTTIINAITYVLIAFVAVSLVVSSIMIGVITLISVQERTKEIGILRAIGASKKNVSGMFNAETVIIGFASGTLGVLVTYLLCIPINLILHRVTGISNLSATLPPQVAAVLIAISVLLTLIAGIIPSRSAARKDPVVALRTE